MTAHHGTRSDIDIISNPNANVKADCHVATMRLPSNYTGMPSTYFTFMLHSVAPANQLLKPSQMANACASSKLSGLKSNINEAITPVGMSC